MMKNVDKKIEQALQSLEGMKPAKAPADMYDRVMKQVLLKKTKTNNVIPMRQVLRVAAIFAGVVLLNIFSLTTTKTTTKHTDVSLAKSIEKVYFQNDLLDF